MNVTTDMPALTKRLVAQFVDGVAAEGLERPVSFAALMMFDAAIAVFRQLGLTRSDVQRMLERKWVL